MGTCNQIYYLQAMSAANQDHETLINHFRHFFSPSENLVQDCYRLFQPHALARNQHLILENQVEKHLYFVTQGIQVVGIPVQKSDIRYEQIVAFTYGGYFSGSFPSLFTGKPSDYFIRALEPSRFLGIEREDLFGLLDRYQDMNTWIRNAAIQLLIGSVNREKELLSMSPRERYQLFLQRSPQLVNKIPQKYIASYLGMTAESYSRMRKGK